MTSTLKYISGAVKKQTFCQVLWLTAILLATQEVEIRSPFKVSLTIKFTRPHLN
jgi:hypothetical protein